jgi:hypothetical protein
MAETFIQRSRHTGVAEHTRSFSKAEIARHESENMLVELADSGRRELMACPCELQKADFVETDRARAAQVITRMQT